MVFQPVCKRAQTLGFSVRISTPSRTIWPLKSDEFTNRFIYVSDNRVRLVPIARTTQIGSGLEIKSIERSKRVHRNNIGMKMFEASSV